MCITFACGVSESGGYCLGEFRSSKTRPNRLVRLGEFYFNRFYWHFTNQMFKKFAGVILSALLLIGGCFSTVQAQGITFEQLIDLFIQLGIIAPEKAAAAKAAVSGTGSGSGAVVDPAPDNSCSPLLTRDLGMGSQGADVKVLQNELGLYPGSSYFGSLTQEAVKKFQASIGVPSTGFMGPESRAAFNGKHGCTQTSPTQTDTTDLVVSSVGNPTFSKTSTYDNATDYTYTAIFNVKLTAVGDDVWIGLPHSNFTGITPDSVTIYKNGVPDTATHDTIVAYNQPSGTTFSSEIGGSFKISKGSSVTVPVTVVFTSSSRSDIYGVKLNTINWSNSGGKAATTLSGSGWFAGSGTPTQSSITVDLKLTQQNFEAGTVFVTATIKGNSQNKLASYWKLSISCPSGVTMPGKAGQELCGTDIRLNTADAYDLTSDYTLLTASATNNTSASQGVVFMLTAFDSSNRNIGSDKDFVTVAAKNTTQSSITVTAPGSEPIQTNFQYKIVWTDTRTNGVPSLYVISIAGSNGKELIAYGVSESNCNGGTCYFGWSPSTASTNNQISIYDVANDPNVTIVGRSAYFNIISGTTNQSVTVLSPNGGERYVVGGDYEIRWKATNFPSNSKVYIELRPRGTNLSPASKIAVVPYTNSYVTWQIPNTIIPGEYIVEIYKADQYGNINPNESAKDVSDASFVISANSPTPRPQASVTVLSPNGGETYKVGDTMVIKWSTSNVTNVILNIENANYGGDTGQHIQQIALSSAQAGAYSWVIPSQLGGSMTLDQGNVYKVWVRSLDGTVEDGSNSTFAITAASPVASCTDSDGGVNLDVAGIADGRINGGGSYFSDIAVASNGSVCSGETCVAVAEGYCSNNQVANNLYQCPSGYSVNGACAPRPVTPQPSAPVLSVTNPIGGSYTAGQSLTISWNVPGINQGNNSVGLMVYRKSIGTQSAILSMVVGNPVSGNQVSSAGSFVWNIPTSAPAASDYIVYLSTSSGWAESTTFTIANPSGLNFGATNIGNVLISVDDVVRLVNYFR
jgi:hypothetical protein